VGFEAFENDAGGTGIFAGIKTGFQSHSHAHRRKRFVSLRRTGEVRGGRQRRARRLFFTVKRRACAGLLCAANFIITDQAGQDRCSPAGIRAGPAGGPWFGIFQVKDGTAAGFPLFAIIDGKRAENFKEPPVVLAEGRARGGRLRSCGPPSM